MKSHQPQSFTLTKESIEKLEELAAKFNKNKSQIVEMLISNNEKNAEQLFDEVSFKLQELRKILN